MPHRRRRDPEFAGVVTDRRSGSARFLQQPTIAGVTDLQIWTARSAGKEGDMDLPSLEIRERSSEPLRRYQRNREQGSPELQRRFTRRSQRR